MIQCGCPQGTGMGGPGYSIKGEFAGNNFKNDLLHTPELSIGQTNDPNSAGSQIFIIVADAPHLDNQYASFGKIIEGMDEAKKIVNTKRDSNDKPYETQIMEEVTVETFGVVYGEPEKV